MAYRFLKKIKVGDLKLGMYVHIPLPWYEHPFFTNHFFIKSQKDLNLIQDLGLQEVECDLAQSSHVTDFDPPCAPEDPKEVEEKEVNDPVVIQQKQKTSELISTVYDQRIKSREKAQLVRQQSFAMMKNLLEHPTAANIAETKRGVSSVVTLILNDSDTLGYLLDITSHDFYTYIHSVEVGILGVALAKSLFKSSSSHDIHALGAGFFLHDLGKIRIGNEIINKPGKLTEEEMAIMRKHPVWGYEILVETKQLTEESKTIVLQHHERADGKGYPNGLSNDRIHIYGRICAIADVYDALVTDRPYRDKMKPFDALNIMKDEMSAHFQKELLKEFVLLLKTA